jgi:hypothetical protein
MIRPTWLSSFVSPFFVVALVHMGALVGSKKAPIYSKRKKIAYERCRQKQLCMHLGMFAQLILVSLGSNGPKKLSQQPT